MEKKIIILHENNHYINPYKKNCFFLNVYYLSTITFHFYFFLDVEGVFFFLMASYLHKKFQKN